jgi:hypothetical protein
VTLEDTFAKVVGRPPSEAERGRLYRLRDALGLRDNDAFWSIVMALEHYDSFFRAYPAQLAAETHRCLEQARAALAVAAQREAAHVHRMLSEKVAQTSVEIARKLADGPVGLHRMTAMLAAVVAFGALCVVAGYHLATAPTPSWVTREGLNPGLGRVVAVVFAVPAGWMVFALLLPAAVAGARTGWAIGADAMLARRERILGWCLVVVCIAGGVACAALLSNVG